MTLSLKHSKISDKADGQDPSLLQPSDWNAEHAFTLEAKKLVGNSAASPGNVEEISVGAGLTLADGTLSLGGSDSSTAQVIVSAVDPEFPNSRVLTGVAPVTVDLTTAAQARVGVADNGITLAKLDHGVQGEILYYGASGAPTRLPPGTSGQVLVSGGASANVAWSGAGGAGGAPHAVLQDKKPAGDTGGGFGNGAWRTRILNTEAYDVINCVTLAADQFKLVAGTYVVEWSAPAHGVGRHQTRLRNVTDNITLGQGMSSNAVPVTNGVGGAVGGQTLSVGIARFIATATQNLEIQHQCQSDNFNTGRGVASNFGEPEIYAIVSIWKVA